MTKDSVDVKRRKKQGAVSNSDDIVLSHDDIKMLKQMFVDFEHLTEYYRMRHRPAQHIVSGLLNGMARGVGFALGITVLAFILIRILQALNVLDLPIIGDFIAELMEYVAEESSLSMGRY